MCMIMVLKVINIDKKLIPLQESSPPRLWPTIGLYTSWDMELARFLGGDCGISDPVFMTKARI